MTESISPVEVREVVRDHLQRLDLAAIIEPARDAAPADPPTWLEGWWRLCSSLGLGELGGDLLTLGTLVEEFGASPLPYPVRPLCLLEWLSERGGNEAVRRLDVARRVVAVDEELRSTIELDPDRGVASGSLEIVSDPLAAELVIAVAGGDEDGTVVVLDLTDAEEVRREPFAHLDLTRSRGRITVHGAPYVTVEGVAPELLRAAHRLLLAREQLGGASSCMADAARHGRDRVQFDRPIGSYQALQQEWAETAVDVMATRALLLEGSRRVEEAAENAASLAALSKASASRTFVTAAERLIQIHGGMGFTWEHDAHLFYRRAHSLQVTSGAPEVLEDEAVACGSLGLLVG